MQSQFKIDICLYWTEILHKVTKGIMLKITETKLQHQMHFEQCKLKFKCCAPRCHFK